MVATRRDGSFWPLSDAGTFVPGCSCITGCGCSATTESRQSRIASVEPPPAQSNARSGGQFSSSPFAIPRTPVPVPPAPVSQLRYSVIRGPLDRTKTVSFDTWSPGAPRFTWTPQGLFVLAIQRSANNQYQRTRLLFTLMWKRGTGAWAPVVQNIGPAYTDPVMVSDRHGRLHIFYPSANGCPGGIQGGNVTHEIIDPNNNFSRKSPATQPIFADDRSQRICTTRYSVAYSHFDDAIYLAFRLYQTKSLTSQFAFARYRVASDPRKNGKWEGRVPLPTNVKPGEGLGYSSVAPAGPNVVYFLHTIWGKAAAYREVGLNMASLVSWSLPRPKWSLWNIKLCEAPNPPANAWGCLAHDLVADRGGPYALYSADHRAGATPPPGGKFKQGVDAIYLASFSSKLLPRLVSVSTPRPGDHRTGALAEPTGSLVVVARLPDSGQLGFWESRDSGVSWRLWQPPVDVRGSVTQAYNPSVFKSAWSGTVPRTFFDSAIHGVVTDHLQSVGQKLVHYRFQSFEASRPGF